MRPIAFSKTFRRGGAAFAFAVALAQVLTMKSGQAQSGQPLRNSVPEDWSSRHVVYSGARTAADSRRISRESRYRNQWLLRNRPGLAERGSLRAMSKLASAAASVQAPPISNVGIAPRVAPVAPQTQTLAGAVFRQRRAVAPPPQRWMKRRKDSIAT